MLNPVHGMLSNSYVLLLLFFYFFFFIIALVVIIVLIVFVCTVLRVIKYLLKMPQHFWPQLEKEPRVPGCLKRNKTLFT